MDSTTVLHEDGTADQTFVMAVDRTVLELAGSEGAPSVDDIFGSTDDLLATYHDAGLQNVTVEPLDTDTEVGITVTVLGATLDEFNSPELAQQTGAPSATITRDGDNFRIDIPVQALFDNLASEAGVSPAQFAAAFTITSTVTFPGKVLEHSGGTVDGKSITFDTNDLLGGNDLYAIGAGKANTGVPLLVWIALGIFVLALTAGILAVQRQRSKAFLASAPPPAPAPLAPPAPSGAPLSTEAPVAAKPAAKKPAAKPAAKKPAATKSGTAAATKKPAAAKKPAAKKPAAKKPPASGSTTK